MAKQTQEDITVEDIQTEGSKWEDLAEQIAQEPIDNDAGEPLIEQPSYEDLTARLAEKEVEADQFKAEAAHYKQEALREKADSDNYKKRLELDFTKRQKLVLENFVNSLLPVKDSLERSLELSGNKDANFKGTREGVELTLKMFTDVLEKFAVKAIDPEGQAFDPQQHEAMSTQPDSDVEPNTVLKVLQKGYLLHDRLIRPALVIVAAKPSA